MGGRGVGELRTGITYIYIYIYIYIFFIYYMCLSVSGDIFFCMFDLSYHILYVEHKSKYGIEGIRSLRTSCGLEAITTARFYVLQSCEKPEPGRLAGLQWSLGGGWPGNRRRIYHLRAQPVPCQKSVGEEAKSIISATQRRSSVRLGNSGETSFWTHDPSSSARWMSPNAHARRTPVQPSRSVNRSQFSCCLSVVATASQFQ